MNVPSDSNLTRCMTAARIPEHWQIPGRPEEVTTLAAAERAAGTLGNPSPVWEAAMGLLLEKRGAYSTGSADSRPRRRIGGRRGLRGKCPVAGVPWIDRAFWRQPWQAKHSAATSTRS